MLRLMKYEFLKQRNSKFVLGGFLLFAEVLYLLGMLGRTDSLAGIAIMILTFTALVGFIVVGLEAITTYYHDLKEKRGYMLFMTPHSAYEIIGGKLLTSILTILLWTVLIGVLAFADLTLLVARFNDVEAVLQITQTFLQSLFSFEISWASVVLETANMVFSWCAMVTSAFLAITLSMTFLARMKAKGFLAFLIYILLNAIPSFLTSTIQQIVGVSSRYTVGTIAAAENMNLSVTGPDLTGTGISFLVTLVFGIACFWCTGYLLKKRLAL